MYAEPRFEEKKDELDETDAKSPWYGYSMLLGLSRNTVVDWTKSGTEKCRRIYNCVFFDVFYLAFDVWYGKKRLKKGSASFLF